MAADDLGFGERGLSEEDELYLMASLHPRDTGLPRIVWASPRGGARHDARLEVSAAAGDRLQLEGGAVIALRPEPRLLHGDLSADERRAIYAWIELNLDVLIDYWEERATTFDLVRRHQRLPG